MDAAAKERLAQLIAQLQGDRPLRDFAKDLGVAHGTVQNWLKEGYLPSARNLEKIASAASMTVEDLYTYLNGQPIKYQPKTAREVFQLALQLSDDERRELIKLLADAIGR